MAGRGARINAFQLPKNSILDAEIDQGRSSCAEEEANDGDIRIWNPVKILDCCGAEQIETTHPVIASENSSDFEDAAQRLLRSRGHKGSYTKIKHIRQSDTWDCGRFKY